MKLHPIDRRIRRLEAELEAVHKEREAYIKRRWREYRVIASRLRAVNKRLDQHRRAKVVKLIAEYRAVKQKLHRVNKALGVAHDRLRVETTRVRKRIKAIDRQLYLETTLVARVTRVLRVSKATIQEIVTALGEDAAAVYVAINWLRKRGKVHTLVYAGRGNERRVMYKLS